ncbi:Arylesterase precursor [Oxalobacteraceae bacterium IMCC9480]|nr:Arylesterase precursor [Oxalobacteraceae bacterium IMCC9480]NDP60949.1 arylesterase [Oxalobacteraceae bacterium]
MQWARVAVLVAVAMCTTSAHSASKAVLVLGDSLSAEYGLARGEGWVALLEQRLKESGIDATLINASISGETTSGGKTRLPALLSKNQPDVVVVELGANDGLRGLALGDTQKNLRDIINAAKKSKARVVLVGMQLPPNYGTDYTKRFAAIFPTLAKETRSSLVPFMLDGVVSQPQLFQADRIHPTAQAHPIILDNIWPQLKPLLSK